MYFWLNHYSITSVLAFAVENGSEKLNSCKELKYGYLMKIPQRAPKELHFLIVTDTNVLHNIVPLNLGLIQNKIYVITYINKSLSY